MEGLHEVSISSIADEAHEPKSENCKYSVAFCKSLDGHYHNGLTAKEIAEIVICIVLMLEYLVLIRTNLGADFVSPWDSDVLDIVHGLDQCNIPKKKREQGAYRDYQLQTDWGPHWRTGILLLHQNWWGEITESHFRARVRQRSNASSAFKQSFKAPCQIRMCIPFTWGTEVQKAELSRNRHHLGHMICSHCLKSN